MEGALTPTAAPRWAQPGDLALVAAGTAVNAVVPKDQVMAKAREWAATICLNGPLAVRACKESAKKSTFLDLKAALANEMSYSAGVFMSDDAKEGIKAFKEKRTPTWTGR